MELKRPGSQPSAKGPAEWFTGTVRIDPLNNPPAHTAQEIADAVLWLCSPGASFVVGVALPIDGGYTAR